MEWCNSGEDSAVAMQLLSQQQDLRHLNLEEWDARKVGQENHCRNLVSITGDLADFAVLARRRKIVAFEYRTDRKRSLKISARHDYNANINSLAKVTYPRNA